VSISGLLEQHFGAPAGDHLLALPDGEAVGREAFRGWRLEPVIGGPHTFTAYLGVDGTVVLFQRSVLGEVWSRWPSLADAQRDLTRTAASHRAMGTTAAPGWCAVRDRVAAVRAGVGDGGPAA
jgi:hypothetical protein